MSYVPVDLKPDIYTILGFIISAHQQLYLSLLGRVSLENLVLFIHIMRILVDIPNFTVIHCTRSRSRYSVDSAINRFGVEMVRIDYFGNRVWRSGRQRLRRDGINFRLE